MFSHIRSAWNSLVGTLARPFEALWNRNRIDKESLEELRRLCIGADMGIATADRIIAAVESKHEGGQVGISLKQITKSVLIDMLAHVGQDRVMAEKIIMLVGINGTGKTSSAAKLAATAQRDGKRVLLVAADTFRAAAVEQLQSWATMLSISCIAGKSNQDPSSVIFAACVAWKTGLYDYMIIDTAGRLQTKSHLMDELGKMRRVFSKQLPKEHITTFVVLDSTLGQNSLDQARLFHEAVTLDGVILTKCDGSGKGGIIFAVVDQLQIPVRYLTVGEQLDNCMVFDSKLFVNQLISDS